MQVFIDVLKLKYEVVAKDVINIPAPDALIKNLK
jgi:hypothetical protein